MAARRNYQIIYLFFRKKQNILSVGLLIGNNLFIIYIRNPLEKQDRNNIGFIVILVDRAAQDITCFKKMIVKAIGGSFLVFF